ncbi:hypothetical protein Ahy_B05g073969 isoform E [Arachis hypogaea]|nr:hypothetical protein Ahy_B05g073969 isoform E [Arachis hypogaea]
MEADHEDGGYDRNKELKLLDETKAGVKGLVDAGLTKDITIKYLDHVKKLALTLLEIRIAFGVIRPRMQLP